jgi:hypothetical protein
VRGQNRNKKPNACASNGNGKNASENKKSTKHKSNESAKSENVSKNKNANVASEHEKNVSKSVSGVCGGMKRSSTSENNAWHASKNAWLGEHLLLAPHHRLRPRYLLTMRLSCLFPSRLSHRPTREKVFPFHFNGIYHIMILIWYVVLYRQKNTGRPTNWVHSDSLPISVMTSVPVYWFESLD